MGRRPDECPHAAKGAVWCEVQNCEKCGWNPKVAEARLEAIKQKMFEEANNGKGNTSKTHS